MGGGDCQHLGGRETCRARPDTPACTRHHNFIAAGEEHPLLQEMSSKQQMSHTETDRGGQGRNWCCKAKSSRVRWSRG